MSYEDFSWNSGTTSVNHYLAAAVSAEEPPPGTNTSEKILRNSKIG